MNRTTDRLEAIDGIVEACAGIKEISCLIHFALDRVEADGLFAPSPEVIGACLVTNGRLAREIEESCGGLSAAGREDA